MSVFYHQPAEKQSPNISLAQWNLWTCLLFGSHTHFQNKECFNFENEIVFGWIKNFPFKNKKDYEMMLE